MTRLTGKQRKLVVELFRQGSSMELLAERMRVGLWQIEAIIREAMKL